MGDYLLRVTEKPIDAGLDLNTAKPLRIGSQYTGKLDNSLADWYVFTFKNAGKYVLDFYNINVGCRVNINGFVKTNKSLFATTVKNEDTGSKEFNVEVGEKLYLEVKPWGVNEAEMANGSYIIKINEKEK
jgi:hypothetical protein